MLWIEIFYKYLIEKNLFNCDIFDNCVKMKVNLGKKLFVSEMKNNKIKCILFLG